MCIRVLQVSSSNCRPLIIVDRIVAILFDFKVGAFALYSRGFSDDEDSGHDYGVASYDSQLLNYSASR